LRRADPASCTELQRRKKKALPSELRGLVQSGDRKGGAVADPPLWVFFEDRCVGRIDPEPFTFTYEKSWVDASDSFPISVALRLRRAPYTEEAARAFFSNLLPEGNVRRRLAGRLGISEGNDYALLAAIGGECSGALSVLTEPPNKIVRAHQELSPAELAKRIAAGGALTSFAGERGVRLSLAGAQDKLPVCLQDDRILLPKGAAASTHILKFESPDFKHLPTNEVFVLRLAAAVGLPAVQAELHRFGKVYAAVIERYDRVRSKQRVERLHQEDFCQALGYPPERKYEVEGGPTFADCIELVRSHSIDPLTDAHQLVRWHLFNAMAGNADGHAKNLALLHKPSGTRLAPFYDLICTRAYRIVDRQLAMKLGSQRDSDKLTKKDWARFAEDIGVGERYIRETALELADAMGEAVGPTLRALETDSTRKNFIRSILLPKVKTSSRRVATSLKT
jgi:serine/threonine-protein kinase HipA